MKDQRPGWQKDRRKRSRKVKRQHKKAAIRAKYGPSMNPGKVTIRSLETGEVLARELARESGDIYSAMLENLARDAGYSGYAEYLRSSVWRKMRREVLIRDGWRCRLCDSGEELHVHHDRYGPLGSIPLAWLKTVCGPCHRRIHGR